MHQRVAVIPRGAVATRGISAFAGVRDPSEYLGMTTRRLPQVRGGRGLTAMAHNVLRGEGRGEGRGTRGDWRRTLSKTLFEVTASLTPCAPNPSPPPSPRSTGKREQYSSY